MKLMPDELWHFIIISFSFFIAFLCELFTQSDIIDQIILYLCFLFLYFCVHAHYCVCVTHSQSQNQFGQGIYCQCDFLTG